MTTTFLVHRFSYVLHTGPIPSGLCVLHRCDNRACVNPAHLFLGTIADNNADARAKGRMPVGDRHPFRLRPALVRHGRDVSAQALLDDAKARAIRALVAMNAGSLREIAADFGVSHRTIWGIAKGRDWKHVATHTGDPR